MIGVGEGWLTDRKRYWTYRFHRDHRSWAQDPRVFVDRGREMPNGEPALLKSRRYLRDAEARKLWLELVRKGWAPTSPVWGGDVEP